MTIMIPAILAMRTHDLPSDESHAPHLPRLPTICRRQAHPELRLGQPRPLVALSATRPEIDDVQPPADDGCSPIFVDNSHQHASRTSRSPSAATEAVPVAEYPEWPFQGFLKRTRIGDDVTYNLEFKLPSISERLHLPIHPEALDICF